MLGEHPLGVALAPSVPGNVVQVMLPIPLTTPPGVYKITAAANDEHGSFVASAPILVTVERTDLPTAISGYPNLIRLRFVGDSTPWTIMGTFGDGLHVELTRSSLLQIQSENPKVAMVIDGTVQAIGSGQTVIRVRYGSAALAIPVKVPASIRGDLDGNGIVDESDLSVILDALGWDANGPNDARDLDHDGKITELDAQLLKTLCTHPHCASH